MDTLGESNDVVTYAAFKLGMSKGIFLRDLGHDRVGNSVASANNHIVIRGVYQTCEWVYKEEQKISVKMK